MITIPIMLVATATGIFIFVYLISLGAIWFMKRRAESYMNALINANNRMDEILEFNDILIQKNKLSIELISESNLSKSEKVDIIKELS